MKALRQLAEAIGDAAAVREARARFHEALRAIGERASDPAADLAALVSSAYPALSAAALAHPEDLIAVTRGGIRSARDGRAYRRLAAQLVGPAGPATPLVGRAGPPTPLVGRAGPPTPLVVDATDADRVRRGLRILARREKLRIATRELLPHAGSDVDVTSRELADLADTCIAVALDEALAWAEIRFGVPTMQSGERCPLVVIGMGKLGGRELNPGSDVDLILFYETDEGCVRQGGAPVEQTLHEHFTRVAQRFIATLEEPTDDGAVW